MARLFVRLLIATVCLIAAGAVASAFAQPARGMRMGMPMYDTKTEAVFTGTVDAVEQVAARGGGRGMGGTHLMLKTAQDTIEVHLGPNAFLTEKNITIAKGDTVEIVGSRITMNDRPVVLAREVKKGDNTWTLRDASGRPLWSGGVR